MGKVATFSLVFMKVFARELLQFLCWNQSSLFDGILPGRGCYICFWFQSRVIFPGKGCHIGF